MNLSIELKKYNSKECVVECGVVHIRNTENDSRKRLDGNVVWRRMEKISWVDKMSNEEVLQRVNETRIC